MGMKGLWTEGCMGGWEDGEMGACMALGVFLMVMDGMGGNSGWVTLFMVVEVVWYGMVW
jgi:hypothetical protein